VQEANSKGISKFKSLLVTNR